MPAIRQLIPLALLLLGSARAIQVSPGSDCAAYCLDDSDGDSFNPDDSTTNTTDIVCHDLDYSTKSAGIKFKNCQECLQNSQHVNGTESDMHWFMYNLRYSISTCLFGKPNKSPNPVNSPCIIDYACLPLEDSLASSLKPNAEKTWSYCDEKKDQYTVWKLDPCVRCLQASTDQSYLANFVVALGAGCEQRPKPGTLVGLTDTVFTTETVNGTAPEEDIRSRPAGASSSTLTTGAIVGIAVGAGLLLFGGLALFCVYWRRQKKYEATEKRGGDFFAGGAAPGTYTPDPFLPPEGAQMTSSLRHMSDGGVGGGHGHAKGVSVSSAEYYDQAEVEMQHSNYNFDPRSTNRGPNGALPSHPAYIPRAVSRAPEAHPTVTESLHNAPPPPPPAAHHRNSKSVNAADTYAMHKYTPSTSSLRGSSSDRSTPKQSPNPPLPPPPPGHKPKVPSLVLPSLNRVRGPKKYSPPLVNRSATPSGSMERDQERVATALQISRPVTSNEGRFHDRPLQGGPVLATEAVPAADRHVRNAEWDEVPMKSGKSMLYGY